MTFLNMKPLSLLYADNRHEQNFLISLFLSFNLSIFKNEKQFRFIQNNKQGVLF